MVFADYIQKEMKKHRFIRFDSFIIEKMGYTGKDENVRHQAFREFRKRTARNDFASMPTMRRWFGINGFRKPSREHVYEMCFAMGLNRDQTAEYLVKGLGQTSFQINDYKEIIFLYGIENQRTYRECVDMIERFENNLHIHYSTSKTHSTRELHNQYEAIKHLEINDFLLWMYDRAEWFKGYSQTTLEYFKIYKKNIIDWIRKDEKRRMNEMLSEAGYNRWVSGRRTNINPDTRESVEKFVKKYSKSAFYNVSESLGKSILELARDVYSDKLTNVRLISEVFTSDELGYENSGKLPCDFVKTVSEKYLSDLIHTPEHCEILMRIAWVKRRFCELTDDETCPEWGKRFIKEIVRKPIPVNTVREAKDALKKAELEYRRRCLVIQREDLLPLIHMAAQQQYLWEFGDEYQKNVAQEMFCNMANVTLTACNMPELSEEYEIDAILLACYTEEDMYNFRDVLSVYGECYKK